MACLSSLDVVLYIAFGLFILFVIYLQLRNYECGNYECLVWNKIRTNSVYSEAMINLVDQLVEPVTWKISLIIATAFSIIVFWILYRQVPLFVDFFILTMLMFAGLQIFFNFFSAHFLIPFANVLKGYIREVSDDTKSPFYDENMKGYGVLSSAYGK